MHKLVRERWIFSHFESETPKLFRRAEQTFVGRRESGLVEGEWCYQLEKGSVLS